MLQLVDQLGNTINLHTSPKRIVSLVPSQTELLSDLGLSDEVAGITKFCIHPNEWFKTKTRIGGTKTADIKKIEALQPDLIIANKEENVREQIEALQSIAPVYVSDVNTLDEALSMIKDIGILVSKPTEANVICSHIEQRFRKLAPTANKVRTAYLIWKDPYMAAGKETFINDMMERCGFENVFKNISRYPEVNIASLASQNCNLLLLSSEPYPFKQKHIDELQQKLVNTRIILVDGEMFSWYGSRLLKAASYFQQLITQVSIKR